MPSQKTSYDALRRRYARHAPMYDRRWLRYSHATLAHAMRLIEQFHPNPTSLVDVGCGTGLLAEKVRKKFGDDVFITGLDVSSDMLDKARERFVDDNRTQWRVAPAESLPLDDDCCDLLTCTNAFHLISHHQAALAEFQRVLSPGGTLVIIDWCRDALTIKAIALGYKLLPGHPRSIRTRDELTATVESSGFHVIHAERFNATWFWQLSGIVARK